MVHPLQAARPSLIGIFEPHLRSLSLVPHMIMLCPRVAAAVGWHPDPRHVFNYLDEGGRLTATTLYWRDGGEQSSPSDVRVVRHGYVLMAREDCAEKIHPYMATAQLSRAWRVTQNNEERSRDVICGSRIEPMR